MTQQPGKIETCQIYMTVANDSLWSIAERAYCDGNRWQWIYGMPENRQVIGQNPDIIHAGMVLFIPFGPAGSGLGGSGHTT